VVVARGGAAAGGTGTGRAPRVMASAGQGLKQFQRRETTLKDRASRHVRAAPITGSTRLPAPAGCHPPDLRSNLDSLSGSFSKVEVLLRTRKP